MAVKHTISVNWQGSSGVGVGSTIASTGNKENNFSEAVAIGTNVALNWAVPHATLQSLFIKSDTEIDLYFNAPSTGSPIEHIPISAGGFYVWTATSGVANPFSADVTNVYGTNAALANLEIRALYN